MAKTDLVVAVATAAGITNQQAKKALGAAFDAILEDAKNGERVNIHGFGTFLLAERKPKTGRNPKTGAEIKIAAKRTIKFKFSKATEDELNGK